MDIGLLGPLHVDHDGHVLGPRDRVVLSALAVRPGEVLSTDRLADALWHDTPPESSTKVVQGCVVRLRKALGAQALETTPHGYRLVHTGLRFDTQDFEALLQRGHEYVADGVPERAVTSYQQALGLWRGDPFEEVKDWDDGRQEGERLWELRRACEEELLSARIAAGERALTADAQALVKDQPWRERRWAILALAQYREGRQADALASIRRARKALQDQLGLDAGADLIALETAVLQQDPALDDGLRRTADESCPWKGLAAYDAEDEDAFHGREDETEECLDRLEGHPLLVLAGPSGCGKSSLMCAGIVAGLRARGRTVVVMVPGRDPALAMASALTATRAHPVLVVDQFEEVFTLRDNGDRTTAWLAELAAYARDRAPVILAVRSDHVAEFGGEPGLARLAEAGLHLVSPLTGDRLRAAIEGPARAAGLRLEHGLVDLLLRDSEGEPGALPLLSHALAETWLRRDGRLLTVAGYQDAGGIRGAVARSADRLYEQLGEDARVSLRWTLLRLVATAPDGEPFRTRVASSGLLDDPTRRRIVDLLARARLVTVSESSVELAHEALARAWPRLHAWLDEDASGQRIWRHLAASAEGWEALGRPVSELYRGARLEAADEWTRQSGAVVTAVEAAFLAESRAQETSGLQALARRNREQAAQNRRLRVLVVGAVLLLVVALGAGLVAVDRGRTAARERDVVTAAERTTLHVSLANRSLALRATDRGLAALLAVAAYRDDPDAVARSALIGTFTYSPGFLGYQNVDAGFLNGVLVPGTGGAAVADGGDLEVLHLDTGELDRRFQDLGPEAFGYSDLRVSGDGRRVVQQVAWRGGTGCDTLQKFRVHDGRGCTRLAGYDLRTGRLLFGPITGPFGDGDIALNHDGSLLATAGGYAGDIAVLRLSDGRQVGRVPGLGRPRGVGVLPETAAVAFAPDGRHLYAGSMAGRVREVATGSFRVTRTFAAPRLGSTQFVIVARNGDLLVGGQRALARIDVQHGRLRWRAALRGPGAAEPCAFLVLAERVGRIYCGDRSGQIEERSFADGGRTGRTLDPQIGSVGDLAVTADDRELLAFSADGGTVSRWRLDGSGPITRLVARDRVATDGYSGGLLPTTRRSALTVSTGHTSGAEVWDAARDRRIAAVPGPGDLHWVGEDQLASVGARGTPRVFDVHAGRSGPAAYLPRGVTGVWRSPDHRRVLVASTTSRRAVKRFRLDVRDAVSHRRIGHQVLLDAYDVLAASIAPDDRSVLVTRVDPHGPGLAAYDLATGARQFVAETGVGINDAEISTAGSVVTGAFDGKVTQLDAKSLSDEADFAGARSGVSALGFSADGSMLSVSADDQTVHVYDTATRLALGDPIPADSPAALGWLRPDGRALAVNVRRGVAVWSLDPEYQVRAACRLAGRNLSDTEWNTYVSATASYRRLCPRFGPNSQVR